MTPFQKLLQLASTADPGRGGISYLFFDGFGQRQPLSSRKSTTGMTNRSQVEPTS